MSLLPHGGDLHAASREFNVPIDDWIDLSTGISPWSWPVPDIPAHVWQRLPSTADGLVDVAAEYYGCPPHHVLPVPGSQWALSQIPLLVKQQSKGRRVALPQLGYAEHRQAWQQAGFEVLRYQSAEQLFAWVSSGHVDHGVVINPNNPSGYQYDGHGLLQLASQLQQRSGVLVVDEAFADALPQLSVAPHLQQLSEKPSENSAGLLVLRSLGKFFGLAGVRLGFVLGDRQYLSALSTQLLPWAVNHPARWLAIQALRDTQWQCSQVARLLANSQRWCKHLTQALPELRFVENPLFVTGFGDRATCTVLFRQLAYQSILVRQFDHRDGLAEEEGMLRFGLPLDSWMAPITNALCDIKKQNGNDQIYDVKSGKTSSD